MTIRQLVKQLIWKTEKYIKIHRKNPNLNGKQIHEIKPVKFGGSPANHSNKIALSRMEHAKLTAFWKSIQAQAEHTLK